MDVSRPAASWGWAGILLAPVELLALVWSVPLFVLLVIVPLGLVLVSALRAGRLVLGLWAV